MRYPAPRSNPLARARGFTLIELMITVAIVAILAAIALPSYQYAVTKSRRTVAQGCLTEAAQKLERWYTTNLTYADFPAAQLACSESSNAAHYAVAFSGTPTVTAYTVTMTPNAAQAASDKDCGTMSINQAGAKTASVVGGKCW